MVRVLNGPGSYLANCDKVKFATYQPELADASARIADARWIVDETKVPIP